MNEVRFPAHGVVGILIWSGKDGRQPYLRIYEPCNPENGGALKKPDGSRADFKDYKLMTMIDPSIKIIDKHGCFEFVEREDGTRLLDFSLRVLGKT